MLYPQGEEAPHFPRFSDASRYAGPGLALALKFLPGAQWNYELLLWLLPAQAAVLWVWKRSCRQRPV